ncbi:hypothetical protein MYA_2540 [Burkholderia sp. KJ006]|nr:hypothetical protein MYA_2540 [Burkholderia sp. KJ006]
MLLLHHGFLSFVWRAARWAAGPRLPRAAPDWCGGRTLRP